MKNNKGITLVALVITIILILILTVVTIDITVDGKLFDKAKSTTDKAAEQINEKQNEIDEIKREWNEIETRIDEQAYNLTINYIYATGQQAAPSIQAAYFAGEIFSYTSPKISGYVPDTLIVEEEMLASDVTYTVIYRTDVIGNLGGEDGIPDEYQAVVTFNVVNGTWSGGGTSCTIVVTLRDQNGLYDEDGAYTLVAGDIPTGTANAGYSNGTWNANPSNAVIRNGGASYTLTYNAVVPPTPTPTIPTS